MLTKPELVAILLLVVVLVLTQWVAATTLALQ
jgi:hypothetical protein